MAAKEKTDRRFWLTIRNPHIELAIKEEALLRGVPPSDIVNEWLERQDERIKLCQEREKVLNTEIERLHQTIREIGKSGGSLPAVEEEGKW